MIEGQARHVDHSSTLPSHHISNQRIDLNTPGDLYRSDHSFPGDNNSSTTKTTTTFEQQIEGNEVLQRSRDHQRSANNNLQQHNVGAHLSRQAGPTKSSPDSSTHLSRSRSRGRSNPSQLLARKQQMMLAQQQQHHHQQQQQQQHDTAEVGGFDPGGLANNTNNTNNLNKSNNSNNLNNINNRTNNDDLTTSGNSQQHHSTASNRDNFSNLNASDSTKTTTKSQQQQQQRQQNSNDASTDDNEEIILSSSTHNSLTLTLDHQLGTKQTIASNTDLNDLVLLSSLSQTTTSDPANNNNTNRMANATTTTTTSATTSQSNNNNNNNNNGHDRPQDSSLDYVYILLAQKEEEVRMAAELGKALLVKNEELSRRNECITEEYSHKLELLEQEKYALKRSLESKVGEFESKMADLQQDCNKLQKQLDEQQQLVRQKEKEKELDFDYLVQQNQRLTNELKQAQESEKTVSNQLEQMIDKFKVRLSNRQDHEVQLDTLREEIQLLSNRKDELERRLNTINCERNNLNMSLEESGDKIVILEKCINDKDVKLMNQQRELDELRHANTWLINKLDDSMANATSCDNSTMDQQQQSSNMSQILSNLRQQHLMSPARSHHHHQYRRPLSGSIRAQHRHRSSAKNHNNKKGLLLSNNNEQQLTTNVDNDNHVTASHGPTSLYDELELQSSLSSPNSKNLLALSGSHGHRSNSVDDVDDSSGHRSSASDCDEISAQEDELNEMCQELMVEIYGLLKRFYIDLQHRKESLINLQSNQLNSPNSAEDSGISADDAKSPRETAQACDPVQWTKLLNNIKGLIEEMPCATCQLMITERADYEHLQKLHQKLNDDLKKKEDQLIELTSLTTTQQVQLDNLKERNGILESDLENCDKPKEEIVKLAWKARDEAVQRKNNAEITLAKTRIENMQITSQLMEVVQQKGELSQRLAQFEDDMHYMTQDSVKAKFTWEEYAEKMRRANQLNGNNKFTNTTNGLTQLLFSGNSNGTTVNNNNKDSSSSLMNQLLIKRSFNLKFWQRSSSNNSTDNNTARTTTTTTTSASASSGDTSDSTGSKAGSTQQQQQHQPKVTTTGTTTTAPSQPEEDSTQLRVARTLDEIQDSTQDTTIAPAATAATT